MESGRMARAVRVSLAVAGRQGSVIVNKPPNHALLAARTLAGSRRV